jgi:GMP synthase (glutamine-hydrolysing)
MGPSPAHLRLIPARGFWWPGIRRQSRPAPGFVEVQQRILKSEHYSDGGWIPGQGAIYPDTIESGGTAKADLINRRSDVNRVLATVALVAPLNEMRARPAPFVGAAAGPAARGGRHREEFVAGTGLRQRDLAIPRSARAAGDNEPSGFRGAAAD